MNDHLVEECDNSKDFKRCPRCKEAVHVRDFEQHLDEALCNVAKPPSSANRCPLCHQDIKPAGPEGWKRHLLVDICPNNERHV